MHTAADTAKMHREAMDKAFENATKAMYRATELLLREWSAEYEARQVFAQVGAELVPGFASLSDPAYAGMTNDQRVRFEEGRKQLLAELRERGALVDYATDGATGRHSSLDRYAERELPRDEVSLHIWQIFLAIAGSEAQPFARFVPKPKQPIGYR